MNSRAVFALCLFAALNAPASAQSFDSPADVVQRLVDAYNTHDLPAYLATLSPSVALLRMRGDSAVVGNRTRDSLTVFIERFWNNTADRRMEISGRIVSANIVIQREVTTWKTGPERDIEGRRAVVVTYRVRNGQIRRILEFPIEPDPNSVPIVTEPTHARGEGPAVHIDEGHSNYHTMDGRYWAFAELLRRDGYQISAWETRFTSAALDTVDILVVANPLDRSNVASWRLPTPSAFTPEEIEALRTWVDDGGALLLITDHMPFAGAVTDLAAAFGVRVANGFARDTLDLLGPDVFRRSDETLADHPITRDSRSGEPIDSVYTLTGSAFQADGRFEPLLVLPGSWFALLPEVAWQFPEGTPRISTSGWLQGAVARVGEGRVAVFGEAAMFRVLNTEQGPPRPGQNWQFVLNLMRWLDGSSQGEGDGAAR